MVDHDNTGLQSAEETIWNVGRALKYLHPDTGQNFQRDATYQRTNIAVANTPKLWGTILGGSLESWPETPVD